MSVNRAHPEILEEMDTQVQPPLRPEGVPVSHSGYAADALKGRFGNQDVLPDVSQRNLPVSPLSVAQTIQPSDALTIEPPAELKSVSARVGDVFGWERFEARYQSLRQFRHGVRSRIYRGFLPDRPGMPLCVRRLCGAMAWSGRRRRLLFDKLASVAKLKAPGVTGVEKIAKAGFDLVVVSHWMENWSLQESMETREASVLSTEALVRHAIRVAETLAVAERNGLFPDIVEPAKLCFDSQGRLTVTESAWTYAIEYRSRYLSTRCPTWHMNPFLAPELRVGNEPADASSTVYSLASTFYAALTGERGIAHLEHSVLSASPVPKLSAQNPELAGKLDAVFAVALSQDPRARFQSVCVFADALKAT